MTGVNASDLTVLIGSVTAGAFFIGLFVHKISKHGDKQETEKCYEIRQEIVDYLEVNRDTYTSILYDDTEYYKNIDDRIGSMRMTTEYGGIIELDCAANLYNIKIEIYTDKNASRLNKIAAFNTTARKTCKMFLKDNHYRLIYT